MALQRVWEVDLAAVCDYLLREFDGRDWEEEEIASFASRIKREGREQELRDTIKAYMEAERRLGSFIDAWEERDEEGEGRE